MSAIVQCDMLTKRYGSKENAVTALRSVSVCLNRGSFTAISGPSGCGKTTLLLCVGGLLHPERGSVTILGQSLYAMSVEKRAAFRAAHIGFMFQQFHLIPYLTVLENVLTPLPSDNRREGRAYAESLLKRFNLTAHIKKQPASLSTGERQRVALARAMINRPTLLLADEPTGNLDEDNSCAALDALTDFTREGGAVLLVTHDRAAASRADTVIEMRAGAVQ